MFFYRVFSKLLPFVVFFYFQNGIAQLETSKWFFGNKAALDFTTNPPSSISGSVMNAWEGVASIADENGDLLFYTDGITVWDRNNNPMPNGNGLNGNPSSAQSGIIVPKPGDPSIYYVFSVPDGGGSLFSNARLYYSVVDLGLNGGLGDVVAGQKNINASPDHRVQEKVTAVLHCNGTDVWVLAHEYGSDVFLVYLIDGINPPTLTNTQAIGESWAGNTNASIGIMKASPNGKMIAETSNNNDKAQVLDFDNATGVLSNPRTISNVGWSYGVEFSPNNNLLYVSSWYNLNPSKIFYQYDLTAANINATRVEINTQANLGAIQLGLDGQIYVARNTDDTGGGNNGKKYLGIISNPNNYDGTPTACGWVEEGIDLGGDESNPSAGQLSRYGLPNFIQSYFVEEADFSYQDTCLTSETSFTASIPFEFDQLTWDFGGEGTSTDENPTFIFPSAGTYDIELIIEGPCNQDTVVKTIEIVEGQTVSIEGPEQACINSEVVFSVDGLSDVSWLIDGAVIVDGQNTSSITASWPNEGEFSVDAEITSTGDCPVVIESTDITIVNELTPSFLLPSDYCLNEVTSELPSESNEGIMGTWTEELSTSSEGSFSSTFIPDEGECAIQITYNYDVSDCDVPVPCEDPVINFTASPMTGQAPLEVNFINSSSGAITYNWNFGNGETETTSLPSNTSTIFEQPGIYVVELVGYNGECQSSSNVEIIVTIEAPVSYKLPNVFTPNGDGVNDFLDFQLVNIEEMEIVIINRWGNVVFESSDINDKWDGTDVQTGSVCTEGVYFYRINLQGINGESIENHGFVHLVIN